MRYSIATAAFALAASVSASPVPDLISSLLNPSCPIIGCISQSQAELFVKRFSGILTKQGSDLGDYLTTADKLLSASFQEWSGSVNSLSGAPIDGPSAGSKAAYIGGIQHAPANNGVNTLYVNVANCKNILWHWDIRGVGSSEYPVKGFNYFALDSKCQATRLDLEFNSIAWGQDTGYGLVWPNGTVQN